MQCLFVDRSNGLPQNAVKNVFIEGTDNYHSAVLRGSEAWLFAGAGIVDGSDPEAELRETRLKLRAMLAPLMEI